MCNVSEAHSLEKFRETIVIPIAVPAFVLRRAAIVFLQFDEQFLHGREHLGGYNFLWCMSNGKEMIRKFHCRQC